MTATSSEKKILIVEDEQIIAHSIHRSLAKAGYVVPAMATSAQEAFELIESTLPDLVLMDIHIQGPIDGVETAKTIRERYKLPVIYLTAHADVATLERAKETEPLGYLLKPLNHGNLPSSIEMALYKHKMDRQLEDQRKMLETILESMGEAVIVTDARGEIEFLNRAAEELSGWTQEEAAGQEIGGLLALSPDARTILQDCLDERRSSQIARETTIRTKSGGSLFVDGQIAIAQAADRSSGAMITLHDATRRRQEEQQIRQEQKMLSIAQLAHDVAGDFCGLFDLAASCSEEFLTPGASEAAMQQSATLIQQASNAGSAMARQLLAFGRQRDLRSGPLNLNAVLESNLLLYSRLCGSSISVETRLAPDLDLILSHESQLQQLAMNLVMSVKQAMPEGGKILLSTSNTVKTNAAGGEPRRLIRLSIAADRQAAGPGAKVFPAVPIRNPELMLGIVNAIVTVAEGSIQTSYQSEGLSITDVFLPAINQSAAEVAADSSKIRPSVLMVGVSREWGRLLQLELEKNGFGVLSAVGMQEALLVAEFCQGSIELIVVESSTVPPFSQKRMLNIIGSSSPEVRLLVLSSGEPNSTIPRATLLARPFQAEDVAAAAKRIISLKLVRPS